MAASEHEQRGGRIEGLEQCRPPWLQGKYRAWVSPCSALKREHLSSNRVSFQGKVDWDCTANQPRRPAMFRLQNDDNARHVPRRAWRMPTSQDVRVTQLGLPCLVL